MTDIRIEKVFEWPIEKVWNAISNSTALSKWFMKNSFKAQDGAHFQFRTDPTDTWDGIINCVVTHIEAPRQLSYSWTGTHLGYITNIHWKLSVVDHTTKLELKHEGFQSTKDSSSINWFDAHTKGWNNFLEHLAETLAQSHEN